MAIRYFILSFLMLCSGVLFADEVKFTASVNKTQVATGEVFEVTFSLNTNGGRLTPPQFTDFQVVGGPNESTSMSAINGVASYSLSYSYDLVASKEGTYTIGAATLVIGGKQLTTNPIKIKVVKGAPVQQNNQSAVGPDDPDPALIQGKPGDISKNLFIRADVDKTHVYLGEQLTVSYKLYTRVGLAGNQPDKLPDLNGFWSQDVNANQQRTTWRTEVYKGLQYNVADLKQTILFPERSGDLTIDPLAMTFIVREAAPAHTLMEQLMGAYKDVKYKIKSAPVTIHVKPLPEAGKPAGFTGAVGSFSVSASVDKQELKANEPINYKLTINGSGNIKLLQAPIITPPADFEKYDPKVTDTVNASLSGVKGKRMYNYLLIPRHEGRFTIEPLKFSYFNPASNSYVTLSTKGFAIKVNKGVGGSNVTALSPVDKQDVKLLAKDIRYIKTGSPDLYKAGETLHGSLNYYLLLAFGPLLFLVALIYRRWDEKNNSDLVKVKSRRANKIAAKHLENARQQLAAGNTTAFYEAVFRGMYGYLSDKLNIPAANLTRENISDELKARGLDKPVIDQLIATLDLCEMARFAPVSSASPNEIFEKAKSLINDIENKV